MLVKELIEEIKQKTGKKVTQTDLCKLLDISNSGLSSRVIRGVPLRLDEVVKIENYFNIDLQNEVVKPLQNDDVISVDFYSEVLGSCGYGAELQVENMEKMTVPVELIQHYSKGKKYSVITAVGDSMEPEIHDNDYLIVDNSPVEQIKDSRIYVFKYENSIFVKRLVLNVDEVVIKSDNKQYRDITKRPDELLILGEIVGMMRRRC